jgi:fatty-acyl-CoA synthase
MNTIVDPIATYASSRPNSLSIGDAESGVRWGYKALDDAINRVAAYLVNELGAASGERVATLARNDVNMVILHFACVRAGAIFVPFNWRLAVAEIAVLQTDAKPALLFHDADFDVSIFVCEAYLLSDLLDIVGSTPAMPPAGARRDFDAPSTLLYTSGTSGVPKGVMVSEENATWGNINFILGNDVGTDSVFLCDMPLFHTAGLFAAARAPLCAGGAVWISKGFDAAQTLARIANPSLAITHYFSVPQMAQMLWNHPGFDPEMLRGLQVWATGGAPNPPAQIERFARAGINMSEGFGMSETGSNFGMPVADKEQLVAKAGSCGLPYISIETRIVDDEGCDVVRGETGELWLRGPSITKGYWNKPDVTAAAFAGDWFKTGDAARQDDDGFFYLVDRKKDMYISGGENVYPAEVEAVIAELADVAESAVIGVADEKWGEVGKAFIIARAGAVIDPDQIIAHCSAQLARFKVPVLVVVTDKIPRTASGKVQKHLLKNIGDKEHQDG